MMKIFAQSKYLCKTDSRYEPARELLSANPIRSGANMLQRMNMPWYIKARQIMRAKEIKGFELAAAIGKSAGVVSQYLNGKRQPPTEVLREIAVVLETTIADLIENDQRFAATEDEQKALVMIRKIDKDKRSLAISLLATLLDDKKPQS